MEVMGCIILILKIATILCPCNGNNTWYLCDLQVNKDALVIAMEELKDQRDDVKRRVFEAENNLNERMKCNQEVSGWLERVQAIEGRVDQVKLKADKEIKGRCIGGYCSINCLSRYEIGKLVSQTLVNVLDFKTKGSNFKDVAHKLPLPLVLEMAKEFTVGMEFMLAEVWRILANDEVRIMGLYGMGGVGKTTLLKQINNAFLPSTTTSSSSSPHGFDVVILVVVSKVINIEAIQKEIGDRLELSSPNTENICSALSNKKFLLLLDDIWGRVNLQSIGVPPLPENTKSKVIFTTRSEILCGQMEANKKFRVECLLWDEAWTLFQEKVGNLDSHPKLEKLARDVAKKCAGLPLALITIGRAMSTKRSPEQWNDARTTLRRYASKFPSMGDEVLPLLKVSYDSLGNDTIKLCFLYCALFPENHSIDKSKLIDYWIGEGLISLSEFKNIDKARNKGHTVIGILKDAGLLEKGEDEETEVKMHDMIRDLALWIAHDCESRKRDKMLIIKTSDLTAERSEWYNNAERIYLILPRKNTEIMVRSPPSPLNSPNLITLIYGPFRSLILSVLPENFFHSTPLLRVLDLSRSRMETFPTSITDLKELRYLSLSGTEIKVLPEELGNLVKLNYLDLSHMSYLRTIPSGVIGSLVDLRVLNLFGCFGAVGWDIEQVYNLKQLNDFGITISTQHNLNKLLSSSDKNLLKCTRHLNLQKFDQQSEESTSLSSPIITLEKLQELLFNLKTLRLADSFLLDSSSSSSSSSSSCFLNLSKIEIWKCNELKDLTWVRYVPDLKRLTVGYCEEIIVIVDGDFGEDVFKKLRSLTISDLPKLKSICRNALAFPGLETIEVRRCPELKKLPFGNNVNNTLLRIQGEEEWWDELRWEEDHDNNNELVKSKFHPYFHKFVV